MRTVALGLAFLAVGTISAQAATAQDVIAECKKVYREGADPAHAHSCPCPEDYSKRYKRVCNDWSAYIKPGGAKPFCYPRDVSPALLEAFNRNPRSAVYDRCHYVYPEK